MNTVVENVNVSWFYLLSNFDWLNVLFLAITKEGIYRISPKSTERENIIKRFDEGEFNQIKKNVSTYYKNR